MIVCSKRAFLNILTQLMDANMLLNANYYIADQVSRNGLATIGSTFDINDDGGYVINNSVKPVAPSLNPYHVNYGTGDLSPEQILSHTLAGVTKQPPSVMFKNKLLTKDCMISTYRFLAQSPKGNGLQIMIFVNDASIPYVYIVCEYLSQLFGFDITFVDKQYRNDIPGYVEYKGNRDKAREVERNIREWMLLNDIMDVSSNYQYGYGGAENIKTFLRTFDVPELFHIHDLIFINDRLEPGNYDKERIVHIIASKLMSAFPKMADSNLMINSLSDMIASYNEVSDDELMSIHE